MVYEWSTPAPVRAARRNYDWNQNRMWLWRLNDRKNAESDSPQLEQTLISEEPVPVYRFGRLKFTEDVDDNMSHFTSITDRYQQTKPESLLFEENSNSYFERDAVDIDLVSSTKDDIVRYEGDYIDELNRDQAMDAVSTYFENIKSAKKKKPLFDISDTLKRKKEVKLYDEKEKLAYQERIQKISTQIARFSELRLSNKTTRTRSCYGRNIVQSIIPPSIASFYSISDAEKRRKVESHEENLQWYDSVLERSESNYTKTLSSLPKLKSRLMKSLSAEEKMLYNSAINGSNPHEILVKLFNVELSRNKIQCLDRGQWLNDEVINLFLKLLRQHCVEALPKADQCFFHSSFFFTKLLENGVYNYRNVARWTKRGANKCDLFSQRMVFVPINMNNTHWTLVACDMKKQEIMYLDSMGGSGNHYLENVLRYLKDEMNDKKKQTLDTSKWKLINMKENVPQQANGYDCGVFMCTFSYFLAFNEELSFSQKNMEYFRRRICVDIMQSKLGALSMSKI